MVFSKGDFSRKKEGVKSTLTRDDFASWTKSVWSFPAASAKRIGHPAPFPVELPSRLIHLYSYEDDVVLDPFMGSGTTAIAAHRASRRWVGYEASEAYIETAQRRLRETSQLTVPSKN